MKFLTLHPVIAALVMPIAAEDDPKPGMRDNVYCFSYNWNPTRCVTGYIEPDPTYTQQVCDDPRAVGHDVETKMVTLKNTNKQTFLACTSASMSPFKHIDIDSYGRRAQSLLSRERTINAARMNRPDGTDGWPEGLHTSKTATCFWHHRSVGLCIAKYCYGMFDIKTLLREKITFYHDGTRHHTSYEPSSYNIE